MHKLTPQYFTTDRAISEKVGHLIIPESRFEMPELWVPGKKPIGSVKYTDGVDGIAWLFINNLVNTKGSNGALTDTSWISTAKGPALEHDNSSGNYICDFSRKTLYGFIWHFTLTVADLDGSANYSQILIEFDTTTTSYALRFGNYTSYITGTETIGFNTTSTNRTAISDELLMGEHVLVALWDGSKYRFYINGRLGTHLTPTVGEVELLTTDRLKLSTRMYNTHPRFNTISFQYLTTLHVHASGAALSANPYHFLEPA